MKRNLIVHALATTLLLGSALLAGCAGTGSSGTSGGMLPPPELMLNATDDAATVRFSGGCEVLFAPNRELVKSSSYCTEQEKAAARRAYEAGLNERNAGASEYRDV